ncbi:MAG: HYR domain-containing protein [Blastocatellia bacterium]|nr:HYR domain-containing protein [Blastocatellia bacterium]
MKTEAGRTKTYAPSAPAPVSASGSLASVLNTDGTFNLTGGTSGSFDASGYRMVLGARGEPRFVPAAALLQGCRDYWDDRFGLLGTNGTVFAIAADGSGNVYIGGLFTAVGHVLASNIARWDGTSWSALGDGSNLSDNGVNNQVIAIAISGGDVYAGGTFTQARTSAGSVVQASRIARWSTMTNSWSALGDGTGVNNNGVNNIVSALAASGSDLYAGGTFTQARTSAGSIVQVSRIAKWDGSSWSDVDSGTDDAIFDIAIDGGSVYVGGRFNFANCTPSARFALVPTLLVLADLEITSKTGSPSPNVFAGNNITYTINFKNNGIDEAINVIITDAIPANTTLVSVTTPMGWMRTDAVVPGGTGTIMFEKATVADQETATFIIEVQVGAATPDNTIITNTASATSDTQDLNQANNSKTAMTTVVSEADLAVTKTNGVTTEAPGTPTTYTIVVTNNGPNQVVGATIADTFPAALTGVTFTSAAMGGATGNTASGAGNINDTVNMPVGSSITYTVMATIDPAATGTLSNTATVTVPAGVSDPVPANNSATDTDTLTPEGDLSVTKTNGVTTAVPGTPTTYTIVVSNAGPSAVVGATVTDTFPAALTGVTYTSVAAGGATGNTASGSGNINDTVDMPVGSSITYTVMANIDPAATGTLSNTATVTAPVGFTDTMPGNNSATDTDTLTPEGDLSISKSDAPDPIFAGNNITYTINFTNNGPSDAQSVTVTDAVPANTTFVSAMVTMGSGWGTTAPGVGMTGNVVFSKATVAAGETATFQVVVNVNSGTPHNTIITNSATAASTTTDPNPGDNTGTAMTTVIAEADLAVTKIDAPDPACVMGNITYTINFVNNGPGPGINTTVTDAVPAGTTFVSAAVTSGTGWTIMSPAVGGTGNVVFSKAMVGIGETAVLQVVVKVNAGTASGAVITNTVTTASTINDPNPNNNTAMATTTVDPVAPTITCPANVTASGTPGSTTAIVNYPAPMTSDNCGVASVVCNPPSGSAFPLGTSTVTCIVTDTAGNSAQCSFTVTVFDVCIEDDSNPGNSILFISTGPLKGTYRICCGGQTTSGVGTVSNKNGVISLTHFTPTKRVQGFLFMNQQRGSGSLQMPPSAFPCTISDSSVTNNNCSCSGSP